MSLMLLVPRGAEAAAVRGARTAATVVPIAAGRLAGRDVPTFGDVRTVVVLGLCGALRERRAGDVVVYRELAGFADAPRLDAGLAGAMLAALPHAYAVRAVTASHVVTRVAERRALAADFDADVVDMESASLAGLLASRGVRFGIVRVVSDDASRELPALDDEIDERGRVSAARVALAFVRDPRGAFAFANDARRALRVLRDVARTVSAALA